MPSRRCISSKMYQSSLRFCEKLCRFEELRFHEIGGNHPSDVVSPLSRPTRRAHTFAVLSLAIFTERSDLVLTL